MPFSFVQSNSFELFHFCDTHHRIRACKLYCERFICATPVAVYSFMGPNSLPQAGHVECSGIHFRTQCTWMRQPHCPLHHAHGRGFGLVTTWQFTHGSQRRQRQTGQRSVSSFEFSPVPWMLFIRVMTKVR